MGDQYKTHWGRTESPLPITLLFTILGQNCILQQPQNDPAQGEKDIVEPEKELTPDQQALIALTPQEHKNLCLSAIAGSMEKLPKDDPDYKECSFLSRALRNGWLVDDIPLLRDIYASLSSAPSAYKPEANKILDQFTTVKANRLSDRFDMLDITGTFLLNLGGAYPKFQSTRRSIIEHNKNKKIYPLEYPDNEGFGKMAAGKDPEKGIGYADVFKDGDAYRAERDELARENTEYVFDEIPERKRQTDKEKSFVPNAGQLRNKMTVSASQAVGEVIGSAVYDEIDEMSRGKLADRRVRLHHSTGTKHQKAGHDVLQLEFAGSGGHDVLKMHKGRNGGISDIKGMTKEEAEAKYGKKAKKPGSTKEEFDYIRYKEWTTYRLAGDTLNGAADIRPGVIMDDKTGNSTRG